MTPRAFFLRAEGRVLGVILWATAAFFMVLLVVAWIASERAHPVLLDLETGRPVAKRPP